MLIDFLGSEFHSTLDSVIEFSGVLIDILGREIYLTLNSVFEMSIVPISAPAS
jgi:hypothetical protein